jgi:RNA polymerase sigma factor (sigma-70 family)
MDGSALSNKEVLFGLKTNNNKILNCIYHQAYPGIRNFVLNNSGTEDDAKDVFSEAMIVLYKKARMDCLDLNCCFNTFLYSVCKNIWLSEIKKQRSRLNLIQSHYEDASDIDYENDQFSDYQFDKSLLFHKYFKTLSHNCQALLQMIIDHYSYEEICTILGIKNKENAISRRYKCTKMLIRRIHNDPKYMLFHKN